MKKILTVLIAILMVAAFAAFAMASGEDDEKKQEDGKVTSSQYSAEELGDYSIVIDSCRLAKSYDQKPVVIVKYIFTNNGDESQAFYTAFEDNVYQNGVGLNEAYVLDDSYNYSSDNQTKEIKKGAKIEVEVAYELNDTTTDIDVEVEELFSFNDKKITKKFTIK